MPLLEEGVRWQQEGAGQGPLHTIAPECGLAVVGKWMYGGVCSPCTSSRASTPWILSCLAQSHTILVSSRSGLCSRPDPRGW